MKSKMKTLVFCTCMTAAVMGISGCSSAGTDPEPHKVVFDQTAETLAALGTEGAPVSVYQYPTTQAEVIRTLNHGEQIQAVGRNSDWICMQADEERYYVLAANTVPISELADAAMESQPETAEAEVETTAVQETETPTEAETETEQASGTIEETWVSLTSDMKYSGFSAIHTGQAKLYKNNKPGSRGITVCVNAGHGTKGGSSVKTQCHPDGTAKVTGGTTAAGQTTAVAVSAGMTFLDGTPEHEVTLKAAVKLRDRLLAEGYSVLMIRETEDVQLDNVARTVLANRYADCHVALHWDSSESDKGAFYMAVPSVESYRAMEPVASTWQKSEAFGTSLISGLRDAGQKIYSSGSMEMDLTQTSYSSVPSIDIELGDKASDHSAQKLDQITEGLVKGINLYFQ